MRPTFLGFEVQKRTLQIAQKHQDVAGNNISNINTPGYTRQRVDIYSMYVSGMGEPKWSSKANMLSLQGQGVNAYGVSQIRDIYIDKRYRENVSIEAETSKRLTVLGDIEDVLDNFESEGLQYHTQQFFNALQDYSVEKPDSTEVAKIAVDAAYSLCRLLNVYDMELRQVEDTYVHELSDTVDYINKMLDEMNVLNQRIEKEKFHYSDEYGPNELYDQMNLYIDELSTYGDIEFRQNANGTFEVKMAGVTVLDPVKFKINNIIMKDYDLYGTAEMFFASGQDVLLTRGELKAFQDMLNGNGVYATGGQSSEYGIPYFKSAINEYARTVANVLNTANGADEDPSRAMFVPTTEGALITAGNIRVSDIWQNDPTMIGKVRRLNELTGMYEYGYDEKVNDLTGVVTLQNSNVKYLISKFDDKNIKFGTCHDFQGSFFEYISFVSNRLGQAISYDTSRNESAQITVDELLDARDDVSAPDFNEEGINMLNYTKWYNASSRMLTALDDMLDKLINGTGRVGL